MFTHLLPKDDTPFGVIYSDHAKNHYLKQLQKDNPGKQWEVTSEAISEDLSRISYSAQDMQQTQQVDELYHKDDFWIFKYDFRIAGRRESTKDAGYRCVVFLDNSKKIIEILMIFHHKYLPKNTSETQFIDKMLIDNFKDYLEKCR